MNQEILNQEELNQSPFDFCANLNMCNQNAECIISQKDAMDSLYSCQCKTLLIGGENVVGVGDGVGERGCVYHNPANQIEDNVEMWPIEGLQIPIHIPPFLSSSSSNGSSSSSSLPSSSSTTSNSSSSSSNSTDGNNSHLTSSTTITEESFQPKHTCTVISHLHLVTWRVSLYHHSLRHQVWICCCQLC